MSSLPVEDHNLLSLLACLCNRKAFVLQIVVLPMTILLDLLLGECFCFVGFWGVWWVFLCFRVAESAASFW